MILNPNYRTCEICGKHRAKGNHNKCSRILQKQRNDAEQALILENQRKHEEYISVRKASLHKFRRTPKIRIIKG